MVATGGLFSYNEQIMGEQNPQPFEALGRALKQLRTEQDKSFQDLSGALEISIAALTSYEAGKSRPSEDLLHLITQYYQLKDAGAKELWRLAGYEPLSEYPRYFMNDDYGDALEVKSMIGQNDDARIVYTDMVQVMVNNFGVIMNFMQGAGPQNQPLAIARIGMSKEHARSVLELLKKTLEQAEKVESSIKQLPSSTQEGK